MSITLAVQDLSKKYESFTALEQTSFTLNTGEITILSGPNGSGKTTLLSCLSGLIRPSSGTICVSNYDLFKDEVSARTNLAFVPDVPRFYLELTAWEHLRFIAMANQVLDGFESRAESILKMLGLWNMRHHFPHHYSRGMQLKLGLALALIRPFEVLLLDEPTSALDEESVTVLEDELYKLRSEGASILLSSHDPHLSKRLGDRHMIIRQGVLTEE
jgi:ABC-2 type transport system ATP-binding protein